MLRCARQWNRCSGSWAEGRFMTCKLDYRWNLRQV
jgi:hypothetical protein